MIHRPLYLHKLARPGTSLVEMLVIISISTVITGVVIVAMAAMFRYDRNTSQHVAMRGELGRLAATVRNDLHQAISCQWDAPRQVLKILQPLEQSIEYRLLQGRWVRTATRGDAAAVTTAYGLFDSLQCECETSGARLNEIVRIRFHTNSADAAEESSRANPPLDCRVVAIVGRDHLLLHQ